MKIYVVVALFVSSLLMSSCSTIGEVDPLKKIDLKGKDVARITGGFKHKKPNRTMSQVPSEGDEDVFITKIDDKLLYKMGITINYPSSMLISPGKHKINVRYSLNNIVFSDGTLWLDAQAEKEYIVKYKKKRYAVSFWIEDVATGELVGSIFGEENDEDQKKK